MTGIRLASIPRFQSLRTLDEVWESKVYIPHPPIMMSAEDLMERKAMRLRTHSRVDKMDGFLEEDAHTNTA